MKHLLGGIALLFALPATPVSAQTVCAPGTYAASDGDFVVLVNIFWNCVVVISTRVDEK